MEAALRELEEETGLAGHTFEYLFQFGGFTKRHHVFDARLPVDADPIPGNEIARCRWFRPSKVATLVASIPTQQIVEMANRHKNIAIKPLTGRAG